MVNDPRKPASPLILLVGMHRSGTSLLGSILRTAGVALPGPLIDGDEHNPEGYFERADITALQEQLLIDLDRWWPSATGMLPLPSDWINRPITVASRARLRSLLAQERSRQPGPWAIKDPRSSLLLPLWRSLCHELDIPLLLVLAVRHPAEVVTSLCQRDAEAAGMTADRAEHLWWHHNQTVLREAAGVPLLVVDYSAWFSPQPGAAAQLQLLLQFCGMQHRADDPTELQRCLGQIKLQHRRSDARANRLALKPKTQQLYAALAGGRLVWARMLQAPSEGRRDSRKQRLRARFWQLRTRLAGLRTPANGRTDPGAWFNPEHYRQQWPGLAACSRLALLHHYRFAGWKTGSSPHPLFDPGEYRAACLAAGLRLSGNPLDHWLQIGSKHGLSPSALVDPGWLSQLADGGRNQPQLRLDHVHPWGAAAEALAAQRANPGEAMPLLRSWIASAQLPNEALIALAHHPATHRPPPPPASRPTAGMPWRAVILGEDWHSWQLHALLQHLPPFLSPGELIRCQGWPTPDAQPLEVPTVVLHLQPLAATNQQGLLSALRQVLVLDCDPKQVEQLQQLGVNAELINPAGRIHHRLDAELAAQASDGLGLPAPTSLAHTARAGEPALLCLGTAGPRWESSLDPSCWCLPGFHQLSPPSVSQARQLAAWLQACQLEGVQLVELMPPNQPRAFDGFAALAHPDPAPNGWLPVQRFGLEINPSELHQDMAWRRQGCAPPPACTTPAPTHRCLWQRQGQRAAAAVCISLHNYANRIETALESVRQQTLEALELIVVDDASSDGSAAVVQAWLEQHGHRFARALLLQHTSNGGLAAARNTAFAASQSCWCFVLDADNQLLPQAVERCLSVAQHAPASTAVVHPLIGLVDDHTSQPQFPPQRLLSTQSWQRERLRGGNDVDAMALVRRAAWEHVGGYTHIPDGWEDFDFWCKLIEAGLHGVLCPQRLAIYTVHGDSMSATSTHRRQRSLSRCLQARHPWLRLPLASESNNAQHPSADAS